LRGTELIPFEMDLVRGEGQQVVVPRPSSKTSELLVHGWL